MEKILAYLKLKLYSVQQKTRRYALDLLRAESTTERCRLNVELSYTLGEIAAYRVIEAFIDKNPSIQVELERMLENILAEAAFEWKLSKLKQIVANTGDNNANFDGLLEAITKKFVEVLLPEADSTVLDVPKKENKENDSP